MWCGHESIRTSRRAYRAVPARVQVHTHTRAPPHVSAQSLFVFHAALRTTKSSHMHSSEGTLTSHDIIGLAWGWTCTTAGEEACRRHGQRPCPGNNLKISSTGLNDLQPDNLKPLVKSRTIDGNSVNNCQSMQSHFRQPRRACNHLSQPDLWCA